MVNIHGDRKSPIPGGCGTISKWPKQLRLKHEGYQLLTPRKINGWNLKITHLQRKSSPKPFQGCTDWDCPPSTWMSRWKLGSMLSKWVLPYSKKWGGVLSYNIYNNLLILTLTFYEKLPGPSNYLKVKNRWHRQPKGRFENFERGPKINQYFGTVSHLLFKYTPVI